MEEGVSLSPKEITWQQLSNFLHGGAGINFLCRQHGFRLLLADSGVDYDLPYEQGIRNLSVGKGTRNFLKEAAMSPEECQLCLERGASLVDEVFESGCNVVSFGEWVSETHRLRPCGCTCLPGFPWNSVSVPEAV